MAKEPEKCGDFIESPKTFWESFDLVHWMCIGTIAAVIILLVIACFVPPPAPVR